MRDLKIAVADELYDWLLERASKEHLTVEELVTGLIVSETGEQYVLPDGRYFSARAVTYRGHEPLISSGAAPHQRET
jgi:hypothetical protein